VNKTRDATIGSEYMGFPGRQIRGNTAGITRGKGVLHGAKGEHNRGSGENSVWGHPFGKGDIYHAGGVILKETLEAPGIKHRAGVRTVDDKGLAHNSF